MLHTLFYVSALHTIQENKISVTLHLVCSVVSSEACSVHGVTHKNRNAGVSGEPADLHPKEISYLMSPTVGLNDVLAWLMTAKDQMMHSKHACYSCM